MTDTHTVATAIDQIESCGFECEAGPLESNAGYRWLKAHLAKGPKYALGEWVFMDVEAEVSGIKISNSVKLCVVAIYMSSDTDGRTWTYALSSDPPSAYHYGAGAQFTGIAERKLSPHD